MATYNKADSIVANIAWTNATRAATLARFQSGGDRVINVERSIRQTDGLGVRRAARGWNGGVGWNLKIHVSPDVI